MNIIRRMLNKLFGVQYVVLTHFDGKSYVKRAYSMGGHVWANPYLPHTRTKLLPKGRVRGACYVDSWSPITDKTVSLWNAPEGEVH